MILDRLVEVVLSHVKLIDEAVRRGIDWGDTLSLYAILHALQIHAQATIDFLIRYKYPIIHYIITTKSTQSCTYLPQIER